jgi:hypothetical protein
VNGVMCGAELSGSIMAATGVAAALPSTINPPSMNFQIVCCRKDRGG